MKKLLLITGDLATGKSTFARLLSVRYGIPMFFKDSIKEVLGDVISVRDWLSTKSFAEQYEYGLNQLISLEVIQ